MALSVAVAASPLPLARRSHPNELELRRIARLLEKRARYRYVTPEVRPTDDGYLIVSPCCSRTVSKEGKVIDIARMRFDEDSGEWRLYSKNHGNDEWLLYDSGAQIDALIVSLLADPYRVFWQ